MADKQKSQNSKFIEGLTIGILIGIILTFGMLLVVENLETNLFIEKSENPESINEIINKCSNQSLFESSECVRDEILTFYKYNDSNTGKDLTFEELIEEGGVCSSWADLYCSIGKEIGFNTKRTTILMGDYNNESLGHAFCVWGDVINEEKGGYVILDQTSLTQRELKMA